MSNLVESLYFSCYYAYLGCDLENIKMYYSFICEEFNRKHDRTALNLDQWKILKSIREIIKTGRFVGENLTELPSYIEGNQPPEKVNEKDQVKLVKEIHFEIGQLEDIIHPEGKLYLEDIENPCPPYGAVDMLYKDDFTVYPLEVKTSEGQHDLLGQILKYEKYFQFKLHYKLYQKVQPITLCPCYSDFVLRELKKRSIITLRYSRIGEKLKLHRI